MNVHAFFVFTIIGCNLDNLGNNYYLAAPKTLVPLTCIFLGFAFSFHIHLFI